MRFKELIVVGALGLGVVAGASSWQGSGGTPTVADARIATVDVYRAMRAYMMRPEFDQARQEQNTKIQTREVELRTRIQANQQKMKILVAGDPELATTQSALEADSQAYRELSQTAQFEGQKLAVEQSTRAFMAVHRSATELASSRGYTHLMATSLGVDDMMTNGAPAAQSTAQLIQELLARPVLLAPQGDDITDDLMLKMDLLKLEQSASPPTPEPAPGGGG